MKLKTIKIQNFLSHENTELNFSDKFSMLLSGKSGSGKSSIAESIVWALYGKGRAENRSLIKKGKKFTSVIVTLKDENDTEYNISRSITDIGKHDLAVTYKDVAAKRFLPVKTSGKKNLQEFIEKELLHSSYTLFTNSTVCLQNNDNSFISCTATKRKEIILEIVNASDYDEYYEKAKNKVKELEIITESKKATIENTNKKLKEERKGLFSIPEMETELKQAKIKEDKIKTELNILLEKESEMNILVSKISDQNAEIVKIHDNEQKTYMEIKNLNQKKDSLSLVNIDELKENIEKKKEKLIGFKKLYKKVNLWNEKMMELFYLLPVDKNYGELEKRLNSQIIVLMKKDVEICPEIGKPCPIIVKERDSRVLELSNDLNKLIKEKEEYLKRKKEYEEQIKALGEKPVIDNIEFSELELLTERLEKKLKEIEQGTAKNTIELATKENEFKTFATTKSEIIKKVEKLGFGLDNLKISYPKEKTDELGKEYNKLVSYNQEISQKIAITKNNIIRIENEEKEIKIIEKDIKENLELLESMKLLKDAFGNNGIKAIVIDYVLPKLEDKINEILSKLSNFRIRLDTQIKTVSGESTKEGLYINIINEQGEIMDFDSYSGGERMRVNVALFEGLASLCKSNFRILDETVVGLDQETVEGFGEVIKELQKKNPQVLCISHIQTIKDLFENKIEIVKRNGTSIIN